MGRFHGGLLMRLLIIGCGSIGGILAKAAEEMDGVDRFYLSDKSEERAQARSREFGKAKYLPNDDISVLRVLSEVDLVIEAASQEAAKRFALMCLERGRDIMVMSVGAFADDAFRSQCFDLAKRKGGRLYIPSGAVCGTDGLKSAAAEELNEVRLISTKGPSSLADVQYLKEKGIDVFSLKSKTVVFEGKARDAVKHFPKNINVAATVSLTGLGFERTEVTIICDPSTNANSHELIVKGKFGEIRAMTDNLPFPANPATSYLAALSAVAALKGIAANVWIGA